jgi:hypothetical protein
MISPEVHGLVHEFYQAPGVKGVFQMKPPALVFPLEGFYGIDKASSWHKPQGSHKEGIKNRSEAA